MFRRSPRPSAFADPAAAPVEPSRRRRGADSLRRASLETLEARKLLSVSIDAGGIVTFEGTESYDYQQIKRSAGGGANVEFRTGPGYTTLEASIPLASISRINVRALGGGDFFEINSSNGLIDVPGGIDYDGDTGINYIGLEQTGGPALGGSQQFLATNEDVQYAVYGSGSAGQQWLTYRNAYDLRDNLPGSLQVIATGGDDTFTYYGGFSYATLQINDFPRLEFSRKSRVDLYPGDGRDDVLLRGLTNVPAGLQVIWVNGDDAPGSDTLTVETDQTSNSDAFTLRPSVVEHSFAPPVYFMGVSTLNMALGFNDSVSVNGGGSDDAFEFTPGATRGSGTLVGSRYAYPINITTSYPDWTQLHVNTGSFQGGNDTFTLNGTAGDDTFGATRLADADLSLSRAAGGVSDFPIRGYNLDLATVRGLTGSDRLNVGGTAGLADSLRHTPTAAGAGRVLNDATPTAPLSFSGLENLNLSVQDADDDVRVDGTAGNDAIEFTPGNAAGAGLFSGLMDQNGGTGGGPFAMTPTAFAGMDPSAADIDVNFFNPGGSDALVFNGTAGDDQIAVGAGEAGGAGFRLSQGATVLANLEAFNLAGGATVRAGAGADSIAVAAAAGLGGPLTIDGGENATGEDVVSFAAGGSATATLGAAAMTMSGTNGLPTTSVLNAERATAGVNGALTVLGTAGDDHIEYRPTGSAGGEVSRAGSPFKLAFTAAGDFTIDPLGGSDSVAVIGGGGNDTFDVSVRPTTSVAVGAYKPLLLPAARTELLKLLGGDGSDTFNVRVFNDASLNLAVDGDLPGSKRNDVDTLNVLAGSPGVKLENKRSKTAYQGTVFASYPGFSVRVDYSGVEKVLLRK